MYKQKIDVELNYIRIMEKCLKHFHWGAYGVMVIVAGNGHGDTSSNPEADCISHSTNIFEKELNPIILPLAIGK